MSQPDYPAAHSMDTTWFAVDADGYLAEMDTGEAGAVPHSAYGNAERGENAESLSDFLVSLQWPAGIEYDIEDLMDAPGGPIFQWDWGAHGYVDSTLTSNVNIQRFLACLHDNVQLEELLEEKPPASFWTRLRQGHKNTNQPNVRRVPNSRRNLVMVEDADSAFVNKCLEKELISRVWIGYWLESSRIGVYQYEHNDFFENWISGPYTRRRRPRVPVKLADLPEQLRQSIATAPMPRIRFSQERAIDPSELGECSSWSADRVTLDGRVDRTPES